MNAGAVFVFDRLGGTWTESAMLLGSDTLTYEGLGVAVALSGDSIAAGCPGEDTSGNGAGAVRVFVRGASAWTEQAKITPSDMDGGVDDTLGNSVALQADTLVVGSWQDDDASFNAGAAYVFRRVGGTWSQSDKHLPAVATGHDWLGFSVALSGNTAVAGISRADDRGSDAGAADVFDACQAIAVLRNGTMTARSRAQLGAVIRPGQSPALDPVRDLHAADVSDLTEIAIGRDAAAVGEGAPGVVTLYELMGSSRVLRVAKQSGDVVLTGW